MSVLRFLLCQVGWATETHEHDLAEKFVEGTFKSPTPLPSTSRDRKFDCVCL